LTKFYESVNLTLYSDGKMQAINDLVVKEKQLTILFNDIELASILCSSGNYEMLVAGFLLSRGLLKNLQEVRQIKYDGTFDTVVVKTHTSFPPQTKKLSRPKINPKEIQHVKSNCRFHARHILDMMQELEKNAETFRLTGGVHSAALADNTKINFTYEDIGRHNAVDKVLGHIFLNGITTDDKCLLLSGRIQSDILVKAALSGIPIVVSSAAPAHLAIELGNRLNITVIGFARQTRFGIYSHLERVII